MVQPVGWDLGDDGRYANKGIEKFPILFFLTRISFTL